MLKNVVTLAIRNLLKNRAFTVINLIGLITAMVCFIAIRLYIYNERNFDTFQPGGENIYRVSMKLFEDGKLGYESARAYAAVAPALREEVAEVEDAGRIFPIQQVTLSYDKTDKQFIERNGCHADVSFLELFDVKFIETNAEDALSRPMTIALSQTTAKKYFDNENPIGKILTWDGQFDLEVTAIYEDYPPNAHVQFDFIISYPSIFIVRKARSNGAETIDYSNVSWTWYVYYTYAKLRPGTDLEEFKERINQLYIKYSDRRVEGVRWTEFVLTPLRTIHLDSHLPFEYRTNGSRAALNVLSMVALLVLVIAWINHINMATNRSMERAKEVGIRKVLGSGQYQLVAQFMAESFLVNLLSAVFSLLLVFQLLSVFRDFLQINITIDILEITSFWLEIAGVLIVGTFLTGFYPALVMSGFKPTLVLKGKFKNSKSGLLVRKSLAVFQFCISFVLIAGTLLIYKQVKFMQHQDLGFEMSQTLVVTSPRTVTNDEFDMRKQSFATQIKQYPFIKELAASTYTPGMPISWSLSSRWTRTPQESTKTLYCIQADSNYFNVYKVPFVKGRNFQPADYNKGIISESACMLLGFENAETALNETVVVWADSVQIVGVVKDFHQQGLEHDLYPIIFLTSPNRRGYFSIQVENDNWSKTIGTIEQHWKEVYPEDPFEFTFLDEQFNSQYNGHERFGSIISIFSIISVIISCLGLYVFVSYSVLQRLKEMGVRKVLGASTGSLYLLIVKDFVSVVGFGLLLGVPIVWYFSNEWLSQFSYRTSIGLQDILLTGMVLLFIVVSTITYKVYRSLLINPITALRQE
jgi:putative ABC transport system permease protein